MADAIRAISRLRYSISVFNAFLNLTRGPIPKVLVFPTGCFYRQRFEHYLSDKGFDQFDEMEFGTFDGIIGCVSAGLGVTMLPRSVVERCALRNEVKIYALPKDVSLVETSFVTRGAEVPSSALERLIDIIVARRRRNASGSARKGR